MNAAPHTWVSEEAGGKERHVGGLGSAGRWEEETPGQAQQPRKVGIQGWARKTNRAEGGQRRWAGGLRAAEGRLGPEGQRGLSFETVGPARGQAGQRCCKGAVGFPGGPKPARRAEERVRVAKERGLTQTLQEEEQPGLKDRPFSQVEPLIPVPRPSRPSVFPETSTLT